MFQYYALLRFKYGVPVFPVAVYLQGGKGLADEEYREMLFGKGSSQVPIPDRGFGASSTAEEYVGQRKSCGGGLGGVDESRERGEIV